jgi:hypothetical protein
MGLAPTPAGRHARRPGEPEDVEAFLAKTRRNAAAFLQELGVRRFDVLQKQGDHAQQADERPPRVAHQVGGHRGDRAQEGGQSSAWAGIGSSTPSAMAAHSTTDNRAGSWPTAGHLLHGRQHDVLVVAVEVRTGFPHLRDLETGGGRAADGTSSPSTVAPLGAEDLGVHASYISTGAGDNRSSGRTSR